MGAVPEVVTGSHIELRALPDFRAVDAKLRPVLKTTHLKGDLVVIKITRGVQR